MSVSEYYQRLDHRLLRRLLVDHQEFSNGEGENQMDHDFEYGRYFLLWNHFESLFPHLQNGHIYHERLVQGII